MMAGIKLMNLDIDDVFEKNGHVGIVVGIVRSTNSPATIVTWGGGETISYYWINADSREEVRYLGKGWLEVKVHLNGEE